MTIPPRFLDELRSRVTLSDIIGRKVRLQRAGREFKGCCPFHNEKTPSFYVNDEKQFYHCFGCGAHGSAIDFLMAHDNLSFPESVEALAGEVGMQVPKASPEEVKRANKAKSLHQLLEDATRWMEGQLRAPEHADGYKYITDRGVSEELLSAYRIGFAPADRQAMRKFMTAQGYTDKDMIEAGVLRPPGKDGQPYAFFRDRIMFPVPDRRGRIVAYGGRILPDHLRPPEKGDYVPAKYMNSSNTPLFDKGRMLYGEPHARQAAIDGQQVIVVEGYLDVMACSKVGFKGAVAPLGTALTEDQIPILWRMIPQDEKIPVLCFDGDNAGRRAAARAVERILPLLKPNHSAKIAFLPDGQDPDTLINSQGAGAFQAILDSAMPLYDFLWHHHTEGKSFDTPESRAGLSKVIEAGIARIPDRDVQYYYQSALRDKLRKAFSAHKLSGYKQGGGYQKSTASPLRRPAYSKTHLIECVLMACLINHPFLIEQDEETAGNMPLSDKRLDALRQLVLSTVSENAGIDAGELRNHISSEGFESDLRGILSDAVYTHASFAKPQNDAQKVLDGWNRTLEALYKILERQDKRLVDSQFADNMTAENENRMLAMKNLEKASE
ncbi:MAG: DNA primase [Pseudomonadota bacterium]